MKKLGAVLVISILIFLTSCDQPVTPLGIGQTISESVVPRASSSEPDPGAIPTDLKVYATGNPSWVVKSSEKALMLQGGGIDCEEAFRWLISKSGGGDFVVLRADDSSGYNYWIYSTLGGVDSVHTLVVNSRSLADSTYVETVIKNAEAVFIAGGDQYLYYSYWKGTKLESALTYVANIKKVPIGGTSAGMHILGGYDYIPYGTAVISSDALKNPYNTNMNYIKGDFLNSMMYMQNVVLDTHFYERDRMGRFITFMARIIKDYGVPYSSMRGIACDEKTAVCIDEYGIGKVFGSGYAFFTVGNKPIERCVSKSTLDWYGNKQAVKCWRVAGTTSGNKTFNLATWTTSSATPFYIYVDYGKLYPSNPY